MFDILLDIRIVTTETSENIIGVVLLDSTSESIEIKNPIGIRSKTIKETDSLETFKIELYSLSEFSDNESMIIGSSKWTNITDPSKGIIEEYKRITSNMKDIKQDFNSINMEELIEKYKDEIDSKPPKPLTEKQSAMLADIFKKYQSRDSKKDSRIRDRWVDKL